MHLSKSRIFLSKSKRSYPTHADMKFKDAYISYGQQPSIKEEHHSQEQEDHSKACDSNANL